MHRAQLAPPVPFWAEMPFAQRLLALRKDRGLSQQALADRVGLHVTLVRRYEAGKTQPSIDALRRIALALSVSADVLLFDDDERAPSDDLRLHLEAIEHMPPEQQHIIREVLDALVLRQQVGRWTAAKGIAVPP